MNAMVRGRLFVAWTAQLGAHQVSYETGRIHLNGATIELIQNDFECEPRGTIEVKRMGPMRP
jgi:hypothetical protein